MDNSRNDDGTSKLAGCILIGGAVLVVAVLILLFCSYSTVSPGNVGVLTSFGAVDPNPLPEGWNWKAPWKKVREVNVRTQEIKETAEVPSKEGLAMHLEASLLFSVDPAQAPKVYQKLGDGYQTIIEATFRSAMRGESVNHDSKDLYTAARAKVEAALEHAIKDQLAERGILVDRVLLRDTMLPPKVKAAIDEKLAADQDNQRMEFVLQKAKKDAEKMVIEAKGISDSQDIIKSTLTENYIRYLWVKALEKAAEHKTATIYVPTGRDGMPLVGVAHDGREK